MTVRGDRPDTGGEGSPTVWAEEASADLVLHGEEADALLKALAGSTEWAAGHARGIPAHERVIRTPAPMVPPLRQACSLQPLAFGRPFPALIARAGRGYARVLATTAPATRSDGDQDDAARQR
ncbi:hypothetical protein QU709_46065 [Streptomyces sp. SX92]|nr:hypothetical protein QU709_46065 [Streptomyces coralus]